MAQKGLKVVVPSAVTDPTGLRKLEHYYGIEFTRGVSNNGGNNGYHKMIGDESLLKEMRFHNQMKIAAVKNAEVSSILNQVNWNKNEDNSAAIINGDDGSDIFQVHTKGVYAIIGGTHPTYERFIVSDQPFSYDGDEAKYYPPYGETPDYVTLQAGVLRSIRNDGVAGTHGAGWGTQHSNPFFGTAEAGGFPRNSLSRFQYEQYARAKNPDQNSNIPYTIVCNQDIELTTAFMFIEFRTKCLTSLLGYGITSDSAPTAANWGKVSGFRMTADGGQTYTYKTFGQTMFVGDQTTAMNMWNVLNSSCPILKMFEAQLAVSSGGNLEAVKDADGNFVEGLSQGVMTGIWTKTFSFKVNGKLTADGEKKDYTVECVLRVPVWRGRTRLWGHCTQWYAGYEVLKYLGADGKTHHKVYRAPSVEALLTDTDMEIKTAEGMFAFEQKYNYLGELPAFTGVDYLSWATEMMKDGGITTAIGSNTGGSMNTYECADVYMSGNAVEGKYERRGSHFGGDGNGANEVLRIANVYYAPSFAYASIGSGCRVQLVE